MTKKLILILTFLSSITFYSCNEEEIVDNSFDGIYTGVVTSDTLTNYNEFYIQIDKGFVYLSFTESSDYGKGYLLTHDKFKMGDYMGTTNHFIIPVNDSITVYGRIDEKTYSISGGFYEFHEFDNYELDYSIKLGTFAGSRVN